MEFMNNIRCMNIHHAHTLSDMQGCVDVVLVGVVVAAAVRKDRTCCFPRRDPLLEA